MNASPNLYYVICAAAVQVKYKEKYEKEKGKAMLDFETPTYVTNKEAQQMQSQVNNPSLLWFKWHTSFDRLLSQSGDS